MSEAARQLRLKEPTDYEWPISWRFILQTPFGKTSQVLTVNAPALRDDIEKSAEYGKALWNLAIAPAMTAHCTLWAVETMCWRAMIAPGIAPDGLSAGKMFPSHTTRENAGCILLCTGHADSLAVRRLGLPCLPSTWTDDGLLTPGAIDALEAWGQALVMGLLGNLVEGPVVWLLAYPELLPVTADNVHGVGFRTVEYVAVCWHTAAAPELAQEPWP